MSDFNARLTAASSVHNRFKNNVAYTKRWQATADRNREIFLMRKALGLYDRVHTYKEIGDIFKLSGERVRQIVYKIERRLQDD